MAQYSIPTRAWSDIEDRISHFERNWALSSLQAIHEYLPQPSEPGYLEIAVELIRTDMELAWESGTPRRLTGYLERFPELAENPEALGQVAFEEYRLSSVYRAVSGSSSLDRQTFADRYGIDVSAWPLWQSVAAPASSVSKARRAERRPDAPDFPDVGRTFCGFDLIGQLGTGACGIVYLARQNDLASRLICLKVTTHKSNESQHLAQLQHGNIVPVYSVHEAGNLTAVCMPFLGISTLKDLIHVAWGQKSQQDPARSGQALISTTNLERAQSLLETIPDVDEKADVKRVLQWQANHSTASQGGQARDWLTLALSIVEGVAEGLAHAHEKGLIHADVKPANILISDDAQPVLLDFHLSHTTGRGDDQWLGGTLPYMAPEQLRSLETNERIDHRADIFSFGVVAFEMLTGKLPFDLPANRQVQNFIEQMAADRERLPLPSVCAFHNSVSPDVDSIIQKCLHPDPDQRYQNTDRLVTDLRLQRLNRPLRFAPNRSLRERASKFVRRHPRLTSASAVTTVSLLLISLLVWVLVLGSRQIAKMHALQDSQQLAQQLDRSRLAMSVITGDDETAALRAAEVKQTLRANSAETREAWRQCNRVGWLEPDQQEMERQAIGESWFWLAESFRRQATKTGESGERTDLLDSAIAFNRAAREFLQQDGEAGLALQARFLDLLKSGPVDPQTLHKQSAQWTPVTSTDYLMFGFINQYSNDALPLTSKLIELDGLNHTAWVIAGNILANHDRLEDALAHYSVAVSLAPDQADTWWLLGRTQQELKRYEDSLKSFHKVQELDPDNIRTVLNIGWLHFAMNQPAAAERMFTEAIERGTSDSRAWYLRGIVRQQLGKTEVARADIDMFMRREPYDDIGYIQRGSMLVTSSPDKAIEDFRKALVLKPNSNMAIENIAYVYSDVYADLPTAIAEMDRLVEMDPDNSENVGKRGVLWSRFGDRTNAHADARTALRLNRSDPKTLYIVAGIFAQSSKIEQADANLAVDLIRRAANSDPAMVLKYAPVDPDIEPIRSHPGFLEVWEALQKLRSTGQNPARAPEKR